MTSRDEYYNRAKQEGYRARSAYKLKQLDETADLLSSGRTVVDLGAAPGGWLQVAAERVGPDGFVVGVDRQRIDSLESVDAPVVTVRGDITEAITVDAIRSAVAEDGPDDAPATPADRPVSVVLSDMAPDMSGEYDLDHARSVHLARQAVDIGVEILEPGGDLAVKVFDGRDLEALQADIEREFQYVRQVRPEASRETSSELYLVAKGLLTGPVQAGDELEVDIVDEGSEGDGVAKLEGFTLFVPGSAVGETVNVRVTDVKPSYGFAEPVE